jgi:hypothetical protein
MGNVMAARFVDGFLRGEALASCIGFFAISDASANRFAA